MPWPLVARTPRRTVHARLLDRGSVRWNATTGRRALLLSGRNESRQPELSRWYRRMPRPDRLVLGRLIWVTQRWE